MSRRWYLIYAIVLSIIGSHMLDNENSHGRSGYSRIGSGGWSHK
jgi:hypothetical protein